jgi:hypothetical protein
MFFRGGTLRYYDNAMSRDGFGNIDLIGTQPTQLIDREYFIDSVVRKVWNYTSQFVFRSYEFSKSFPLYGAEFNGKISKNMNYNENI